MILRRLSRIAIPIFANTDRIWKDVFEREVFLGISSRRLYVRNEVTNSPDFSICKISDFKKEDIVDFFALVIFQEILHHLSTLKHLKSLWSTPIRPGDFRLINRMFFRKLMIRSFLDFISSLRPQQSNPRSHSPAAPQSSGAHPPPPAIPQSHRWQVPPAPAGHPHHRANHP